MKKILSLMLLCAAVAFASCSKDDEPTIISVEAVKLDEGTLSLLVGNAKTLTATITPENTTNKTVTWKSSDESIASVADGLVTALKVGKTTITATTVDGAKIATCEVTVTTPLAMGDFYLNDGTIISKDATLTAEEKTKCIGIVFKVGKDADGDWKDDCVYMQKDGTTPMKEVKGYVLALYDSNDKYSWGTNGIKVGIITEFNKYIGFYGYKETQQIIKYATDNHKDLETAFPATYYAAKTYEVTHPTPTASSGWFLPSSAQCKYWLDNQEELLKSIQKASTDDYSWKDKYWTSSEYWYEPENNTYYLRFDEERMFSDYKAASFYIRPLLAI